MFASKSERKVHYSIRKFSIGVASVVVASLFLGGVVHAEEVRRGNNLTVTSSGDEVESHYQSILEKVRKSLEKDRHTQNVDLIKKLQDIKRTYLYNLKEKPEAELTSKTKKELDAAFEKFKKEPELTKKLAEAEKKAKDQKEEDHRNYPTNTYKTIELEIAEAEVGVAKAELELAQAQVQIPQDTEKINAAKAKVEAAKSNVKKLEKIKSDIEKTYLYKLDESTQKAQLQELVTESQSKLDEAFSKFKNGLSSSSSSGSSTKPETPQPEKPEHQKPTTPAPDTKPSPQPEGKKPSVPDINQEKEKAKLAVATYMSKILDDIQKHHLQKEKHRQIVALIKELDELKKQALSEIDNVNTKVEIENTVHKIFADMDAVVTKFKKGLTQDTPKEPGNKKPSAPKPGMQPSPQPEVKPQLEKPKPEVKPQPEKPKPEVKPQPEKPKPEVKPQLEKPKPEVKPQPEKPKP
ncbi:TPA: pneumococcal surface protein PspC, LPXTG-anchored form, partial [Streptococcus pneumoniae]